jgi:hypothetical protein
VSAVDVIDGRDRWCVEHGDCLDVLASMPEGCADSVVTDCPYGLGAQPDAAQMLASWLSGEAYKPNGTGGFMGRHWDAFVPGPHYWKEAFRVLKPGGHLVTFSGSRTVDLIGLAIRLAGFEFRDTVSFYGFVLDWIYGSGMPHSLNISKALDKSDGLLDQREIVHTYTAGGNAGTTTKQKGGTFAVGAPNSEAIELHITKGATEKSRQWDGWGTNLRPSHEPIVLARKPIVGSISKNTLEHGVGGINIDACRIPRDWNDRGAGWHRSGHSQNPDAPKIAAPPGEGIHCHPDGGWPGNVVLGHHPECSDECIDGCPVSALDEQGGSRKVALSKFFNQFRFTDADKPFFYCPKASRAERDAGLDSFRALTAGEATLRTDGTRGISPHAGAGRTGGAKNPHATVKPIELLAWLLRMVTPRGGLTVDPYCGSGSMGVAAMREGFRYVGIERENTEKEPFVDVARARITHATGAASPVPVTAAVPKAPLASNQTSLPWAENG